jgi:hypothetical protein
LSGKEASYGVPFRAKLHQIFIDILHFIEVTVDVVEVEAARESLVIGSVWGMARERMQDNDEEKLQNTGSPALSMAQGRRFVNRSMFARKFSVLPIRRRAAFIESAGEPKYR